MIDLSQLTLHELLKLNLAVQAEGLKRPGLWIIATAICALFTLFIFTVSRFNR